MEQPKLALAFEPRLVGLDLVMRPERLEISEKSQRLLVEDDGESRVNANSRTYGPILRGAKSGIGRETASGREMISGNGLDLKSLTGKEGGTSLGLDDGKTEKRINSQRIQ